MWESAEMKKRGELTAAVAGEGSGGCGRAGGNGEDGRRRKRRAGAEKDLGLKRRFLA
jgi:hypothetical protein